MGRLYQPSRSGRRWSIWWISYWDRSQRRELRESSGSRSRRVALKLLAQREAEAAARPIRQPDGRRRSALAHDGSRRGARGRQHHGLSLLRRAVQQLGPRPLDQALDPQSPIGRALAEWRRDLTTDLGGPESITTAQAGMVELAVRTKLMLDTVDGFILTMESPVNRRRRSVYSLPTKRRVLRMPRMTNSSGAAQSVTNSSGGSGRSKTFIGRSTPRRRRTSDRASGDEAADLSSSRASSVARQSCLRRRSLGRHRRLADQSERARSHALVLGALRPRDGRRDWPCVRVRAWRLLSRTRVRHDQVEK
jgi:hypothetical protein